MMRLPLFGEKPRRPVQVIRIPASKPRIPPVTDPVNLENVRLAAKASDQAVEKILKSDGRFKAACSRGCSACCYEPVYADFREAALVADSVKKMPPEDQVEIKNRLQEWISAFRASPLAEEERPDVIPYRRMKLACPLLDIKTGDCRVYSDRPLNCRSHIALGPREWCEDERMRKEQSYFANVEYLQGVMVLLLGGRSDSLVMDHLCSLLAEILLGEVLQTAARTVGIIEIVEE